MVGDALQYRRRPLAEWMRRICDGRIALPSFRGGFVWDPTRARNLIEALLRDRPVGTLLSIPRNEDRFRSRPVIGSGTGTPAASAGELILDGQQRLTALWRAFHNEPEPLFIRVRGWDEVPLEVEAVRSGSDLRLRPGEDECESAVRQYEGRCIPFSVVGIDSVTQPEDATWIWCKRAMRNDGEKARLLERRIQREIAEPFRHRGLWHLTLPDDVSREEAIDIFVRTNESSAVIRRSDIAVALYDSQTGGSLREDIVRMVEDLGEEQVVIHRFFDTEEGEDKLIPVLGEVLFKVSCLRCEFSPTESRYTEKRVREYLRDERAELRDALVWALEFYRQEGIPHRRFVPSDVPIRVLPALYPAVRDVERKAEARIRRFLRGYLWRAFLTDRYSRSANTRLQEDYRAILANLDAAASGDGERWRRNVPIFRDHLYPLPKVERLADLDEDCLRSPRRRDSLAKAIFAISLREGRDLATGEPAGSGFGQQWDYHHLFPKDYLRKAGVSSRQFDHGLNFALVTEKTNSIIRNKPPHEYLTVDGALARAANGATEDELPRLVASHRIPYEALVAAPKAGARRATEVERLYRAFIAERARMMHRAMEALAKGQASVADD